MVVLRYSIARTRGRDARCYARESCSPGRFVVFIFLPVTGKASGLCCGGAPRLRASYGGADDDEEVPVWKRQLSFRGQPYRYAHRQNGVMGHLQVLSATAFPRSHERVSVAKSDEIAVANLDFVSECLKHVFVRVAGIPSDVFSTKHMRVLSRSFCDPDFLHVLSACLPCLLYTSPSPRDRTRSRMPSSA